MYSVTAWPWVHLMSKAWHTASNTGWHSAAIYCSEIKHCLKKTGNNPLLCPSHLEAVYTCVFWAKPHLPLCGSAVFHLHDTLICCVGGKKLWWNRCQESCRQRRVLSVTYCWMICGLPLLTSTQKTTAVINVEDLILQRDEKYEEGRRCETEQKPHDTWYVKHTEHASVYNYRLDCSISWAELKNVCCNFYSAVQINNSHQTVSH